MKRPTIVGFDYRPVAEELLCPKSLANVPLHGYTSRLKWNDDPADQGEKNP